MVPAFLEGHGGCVPNRVEWVVWLPPEHPDAAVTITCACGQAVTVPCARVLAWALVATWRADAGAVLVVPIQGLITRRPSWLSAQVGGTALSDLSRTMRAAAADPAVSAILLDVDSPGGEASGVDEAAVVIAEAAAVKPVIAAVSGMAASGAYWLASQAREVWASPSALVGSIGVLLEHVSTAGFEKAAGVETTLIVSSPRKAGGHPSQPLSAETRGEFQAIVDEIGAAFVAAVARGRQVTPATVAADFGRGAIFTPKAARRAGMVDTIGTVAAAAARAVSGRLPAAAAADVEIRARRLRALAGTSPTLQALIGGRPAVDPDVARRVRRLRGAEVRAMPIDVVVDAWAIFDAFTQRHRACELQISAWVPEVPAAPLVLQVHCRTCPAVVRIPCRQPFIDGLVAVLGSAGVPFHAGPAASSTATH